MHDTIFFLLMGQPVYTACCPHFIPSKDKTKCKEVVMLTFYKWIPGANSNVHSRKTSQSLPGYQAVMSNQIRPLHQITLANKFHSWLVYLCTKMNFPSGKFLKTSLHSGLKVQHNDGKVSLISAPERFASLRFHV